MKTQSKDRIELVEELAEAIEQRKAAEAKEKALKALVAEFMGEEAILEAGDFAVVREIRSRRDLDKTALEHDMGHEFVFKYTKVTEYTTMVVKNRAVARLG